MSLSLSEIDQAIPLCSAISAEYVYKPGSVQDISYRHFFSAAHEKSARFVTIAPHRSHFLYGMDPVFIHTALILRIFILLSLKAQNVQVKRQINRIEAPLFRAALQDTVQGYSGGY